MQYILTEEEMQEITADRNNLRKAVYGTRLDALCQHIATTMIETAPPLGEVWSSHGRYPKTDPHGCIHVRGSDGKLTAHYCDACPVSHVCQQYKEWSK